VDYYCWLVWCERKILFWLKIYDRLRPSEQAEDRRWRRKIDHHHLNLKKGSTFKKNKK